MTELSHINSNGEANMVDVSDKPIQKRIAIASGQIILKYETITKIRENLIKKGDVLATARIAGIQAAKNTSVLIPLCHNVQLSKISVEFEIENTGIKTYCTAICSGQTGVEMEALTGVSVALLTIYDMCKAIDKSMVISQIKLDSKTKQSL